MPDAIRTRCFSGYMGAWAILPSFLSSAVSAVKSGLLKPRADADEVVAMDDADMGGGRPMTDAERLGAGVTEGGVGIIPLVGVLMKGWSKFDDGTSTVAVRRVLRQFAAAKDVKSIVLAIDSPGGHVSGLVDLADDVAAVNQTKPVHAFVEDLAASAALWVASQARSITAGRAAEVGSVGVFTVLEDWSKAYVEKGVTVHLVTTGAFKGAGAAGVPITPEQVADVQRMVDQYHDLFVGAVAKGRGMTRSAVQKVADGRTWLAPEAKSYGLIDRVGTFDDLVARLGGGGRAKADADRVRVRLRLAARRRLAVNA